MSDNKFIGLVTELLVVAAQSDGLGRSFENYTVRDTAQFLRDSLFRSLMAMGALEDAEAALSRLVASGEAEDGLKDQVDKLFSGSSTRRVPDSGPLDPPPHSW